MRNALHLVYVLVLLFAMAAPAAAQPDAQGYVQAADGGQIDWRDGMVLAKGVGAPPPRAATRAQARAMAVRAATVVARRNLLEIIKGVQIDSSTSVENYMISSDVVVTQVRGFLQNSQVLDTAYMSDGSVEVTVGIRLRGGFADVLLPKTMPFNRGGVEPSPLTTPIAQPTPTLDVLSELPGPAETPETPPTPVISRSYTGMIIDARGLNVRPAMAPKVLDENGNEVYGSSLVSREYALKQGMAGYAKDMESAAGNPRVAGEPLKVRALQASGKTSTDVIISNADADLVRGAARTMQFLEQCRVMIVLD